MRITVIIRIYMSAAKYYRGAPILDAQHLQKFFFQWCLLEHFSGRPTSILCQSDDTKRQKLILEELTEKDLYHFMNLPSFKKLVASKPEQVHRTLDMRIGSHWHSLTSII